MNGSQKKQRAMMLAKPEAPAIQGNGLLSGHAPAIAIALEHQSAPKKSWADTEVEKAAEEIRTGQFTPDMSSGEFFDCGETQYLAQHPRVIAALAKLEEEKRDSKTSQEALEKSQMLHEMNERAAQANQWDGQGRWMGKENEEMRHGLILTPFQFMERLEKVIGVGRVFINRYAVNKRVALLAPDRDVKNKSLILIPGQPEPAKESGQVQIGTLQWPCGTEWMIMRFDEYGVPTTAKYLGWRTALLSMIQLGVISEKEAHKAFPLGTGPAASWYKQQLFIRRSSRGTVQ
jgi:hypothetical protein